MKGSAVVAIAGCAPSMRCNSVDPLRGSERMKTGEVKFSRRRIARS